MYVYPTTIDSSTGSVNGSLTDGALTLTIGGPLTNGTDTVVALDGQELEVTLTASDATGVINDNLSVTGFGFVGENSNLYTVSSFDLSPLASAGIQYVKFNVSITPGVGNAISGVLSQDGTSAFSVQLQVPPPSVIVSALAFSIQPKNTYVQLPIGSGLTFSDGNGNTTLTEAAGEPSVILTFAINDDTGYPNNANPLIIPTSFSGSDGYIGNVTTPNYTSGNTGQFYITYSGVTYPTGISYSYITPSIQFQNGGPTISAGITDGTLLLTCTDNDTTYYDTNNPNGIGVVTDGGNMVTVFDGDDIVQSGQTLTTDTTVVPGGTVIVGYQSASAIAVQATYGITDFFLNEGLSIALPGITYTSQTNGFIGGEAQYTFTDLSVMGITSSNLFITSPTGATFGVSYSGHSILTGVTGSISDYYLAYSGGGTTLSLPPISLSGNNQMSTLELNYIFEASAGQTFTFNVLGESGFTGITYQQTISLDVPTSTLNKVFVYASNWASAPGSSGTEGYQPQPAVAFMVKEFVGSNLDDLTQGLTGSTAGISYPSNESGVITGDQGTTCDSLIKSFQSIGGFTFHDSAGDTGITTDYLANIPQEAISSFSLSAVDTTPLSTILGNLIDPGNSGGTGPSTLYAYSEALQSIFEQAVNAGMVQAENEIVGLTLNNVAVAFGGYTTVAEYFDTNSDIANETPIYGLQWTAGQELAMYVQYNLSKNRTYQLSPLADLGASGATGAVELVFGGVTFTLGGLTESSTAVPVTYKIVLHAV
jgi:hypothetical protein